jgi:hypothetical protein
VRNRARMKQCLLLDRITMPRNTEVIPQRSIFADHTGELSIALQDLSVIISNACVGRFSGAVLDLQAGLCTICEHRLIRTVDVPYDKTITWARARHTSIECEFCSLVGTGSDKQYKFGSNLCRRKVEHGTWSILFLCRDKSRFTGSPLHCFSRGRLALNQGKTRVIVDKGYAQVSNAVD